MSGELQKRIILHIDMNSYFATVEQQARPSLRGKPIGVTGSTKTRTIIAAASVEAKKLGVKSVMNVWEAKKICPQLILVSADCTRYESISRQFIEIFISKTPQVEIFSIDEAFLDLSDQVRSFEEAEKVALDIKEQIRHKIGGFVKCSVGIAQNKFMAKLASEAKKPDGLTVVIPGEEIEFIDKFELTDACGIGSRINKHLNELGVRTFKDLRKMDQTTLTLIFKSYGLRLYNMARGIDSSPVVPYFYTNSPKSISRSKTLMKNTWDRNLLNKMILAFCQSIGSELRRKNILGGSVAVWLRYGDFTSFGQSKKIKTSTNSTTDLYLNLKNLFSKLQINKPIRKIGVWIGEIQPDNGQLPLLSGRTKMAELDKTTDRINKKYGKLVVKRSSLVNLGFDGAAPAFGFKKVI